MAGKFLNTVSSYGQMIENASSIVKDRLDNPYYLFTDKKGSLCTYYNINTTMSTLDESTRGNYGEISPHDPVRFNKINKFMLYGISKIDPSLELNEMGLEGSDITGEAIVLPRTIIPYPGDRFYLQQLEKPYLFRVTSVNPNTLDTGVTLYRIAYTLETSDGIKNIEPQVVRVFTFNINTGGMGSDFGTNMTTSIIDDDVYNSIKDLESITTLLKDYYISLFYDSKVQTFTYPYNQLTKEWYNNNGESKPEHIVNLQNTTEVPFSFRVYDPYMIEFIMRNNILNGSSTYIHISQVMYLPSTFALDYDRTIFSSIENNDINKHEGRNVGNLILCDQRLSILYAYPQDYYYMKYHDLNVKFFFVSIFDDPGFINNIKNSKYTNHIFKDLIIKYFNNIDINNDDIEKIRHLDYMNNKEFFYGIPLAIYVLEKHISKLLTDPSTKLTI